MVVLKQITKTKSVLDEQIDQILKASIIASDELQKDRGYNKDNNSFEEYKLREEEIKRLKKNSKAHGIKEYSYGGSRKNSEYPYGKR